MIFLYSSRKKIPFLKSLSKHIPEEFVNMNDRLHLYKRNHLQNFKISEEEILLESFLEQQPFNAFARIYSSDLFVYDQIFIDKEYRKIIDLFKHQNQKPLVILDCGSNVGYVSLFFNLYSKGGQFFCVEPDRGNCKQIAKNLKINKIENFKIYQKALWSSKTSLYLNTAFRDGLDWSFNITKDETGTMVESISIQDIIQENSIKCIDILKIDIEGSEKEIFEREGANFEWLNITKVVVIEIHDELANRNIILSVFDRFGFDILNEGELTYAVNKNLLNTSLLV